jgi:alpha-2-macroglobulin
VTQPQPASQETRAVPCLILALVALCLPIAAGAATVEAFSPQGTVKDVRQVAARFSESMVAFGDPRLPEPFVIDCAAKGRSRWADPRNWIYDFESELPAGLVCNFTLHEGLKSVAGAPVTGRRQFGFDTGGPSIRASLPMDGDSSIDADQVFVLAPDAPAAPASVVEHAACAVENVAERIPVDVLSGDARAKVLAQRRRLGYRYLQLFESRAGEAHVSDAREAVSKLEEDLTVLRCRRSLPPDTRVSLVWGRGIATAGGRATRVDQVLSFRTRADFTVRVECERVNANAPCLPMRPVRVVFSAPVPAALARNVTLTDGGGRKYAPAEAGTAAPVIDSLTFEGPFPERGELTIALGSKLKDDAGRAADNAARFPLKVALDDYPPLVKFSGEFGILETGTGGVLAVTVRNVEAQLTGRRTAAMLAQGVPGQTFRIEQDRDIARWLQRVRRTMVSRGEWQAPDKNDAPKWRELTGSESVFTESDPTSEFALPVAQGGRSFEVVGIPLREPGFYVVELASPRLGNALLGADRPRYVASAALVTNLAVHFKWGRASSRVWVTALDSGRPVPRARLRIGGYCSGDTLWEGETDSDGIAIVSSSIGEPHGHDECNSSQEPLMVSARAGNDMSFSLSGWQQGISPSEFHVPVGWSGERATFLARTVFDRSLLRAGETLSMKHFFRQRVPEGLRVPEPDLGPTRAVLTHSGSGQQFRFAVKFDTLGIGESSFVVPKDARLGDYTLALERGSGEKQVSYDAGSIRVEQFRVPTMKAVIQPPSTPLVKPKDVTLDLFVGYLTGGGASRAPVRLRTVVEPRWVSFRDYADFAFAGGDVVEGISDPNQEDDDAWWYATQFGRDRPDGDAATATAAQVRPLTLDDEGAARATVALPAITSPRSLVAELEYEDANGERLTTSTRVPLWPAAISLGIRTEGWVATPDELRFTVVAVDTTGRPRANQPVTVDVFQRETYSYRTRLIGGFYAYENKREVKRLPASCRGHTDRQGMISCSIAPEASGEILLRAAASDKAGNTAITSTTAWVAGGEDWWFAPGNADRMDLLPEAKEYEPGGKARFQVRMPFRSATALVTVEREGVLESFVTRLSGRKPVIEVPIADNYAPNVYVSVLAVRGRIAGWRAWLADLARKLGLSWRLEGGAATSLADLSKPAFRLGVAQVRVGWSAQRLDVKVSPSSATYRVRDKAIVDVAVRRDNGERLPAGSEIALAAVDEGLLELRPNESWALLGAMMDERPIEVWTSTAQMQVVGKRHYGRKAVPTGGGGGRAGARELFDTLLLWRGRVKLDAAGRARIVVPLNDSLTSFRIVAVANAGSQYFGTGHASIHTTQELMLHAGLPPLVREGDRYAATFTLRNASKRRMTVRASAKIGKFGSEPDLSGSQDAASAHAGKIGSELKFQPLSVEIPAGGARELVWQATAPIGVDELHWNVEAVEVDGQARDALRATQQVTAAFPVRTQQATLTQLDGSFALPANPPGGAIPGRGGINVMLRPKLAGSLEGVREYMARYPYACLEQRISKAVALRSESIWNAEMARLPLYLDGDGLLRYFPTEALPGSDVLTTYVLALAQEAGYAIPDDSRSRMIEALKGFVAGRTLRDSVWPAPDLSIRKLAAIEALSRYGDAEASMLTSFALEPNLWPTSAVIDWASLLTRITGVPRQVQRLSEARQILRSRLNFQGTTMGFARERQDALWWLMISGDVNAARAVLALLDAPEWRDDVPRMMRGLLERQQRGRWDTTTANAWGVLAAEKVSGAYEATPVTGRTVIGLADARREVIWPQPEGGAELAFPLPSGAQELTLAHDGTGRPWALIQSRAALPLASPLFTGYSIRRTVTPVERRKPGIWTRGDVVRVRLDVDAQSDMGWVVLDDPVPAGATILGGGLGRDSALLTGGEQRAGWVYPAFEERRFDGYRAYYTYVPTGSFTVEYTLRLNNAGTFSLPATRVEAMYAPEMFGELPNAAIEVRGVL